MSPYIPYGYQPKGEQWVYPSEKKHVLSTLGFLNPKTNHLVTYDLPENERMNSDFFIKYVNDFVETLTQLTILIIDNASYHKSEAVKSKYKEWEAKGLYILYLPPRSPHLNKIEILWRKIKYKWLSIRDYRSAKTLTRKLKQIFREFGMSYNINFS
mgnify:CR=1 FL=1